MRAFTTKKWLLVSLSILIVAILLLSGCGKTNKITTSVIKPAATSSNPHPPVKTGNINAGIKIQAATQAINPSGGTITISKQGDPLDGFSIEVPSSSYSGNTTFNVSYAPITNQTFGGDITPISPMIYVDNGGAYANEIMEVQVPVTIPADSFAMGIIYDDKTKTLEGMPLIAEDANSITVGTRHFSNFFISLINKAQLSSAEVNTIDIDTGFNPGTDDWEFTNYGTYIAPGGQCAGQSESALWYYVTQPDGPNVRLYGAYDNNGNTPATPDFWQDDSLGYRFASTIQDDINWDGFAAKLWNDQIDINDELTWDLFVYSMEFTGEPQMVGVRAEDGEGHAMICYRVDNGKLYVADPNYPGNSDREIEYADGEFEPYNSGENAADIQNGSSISFNKIGYEGTSAIIDWGTISQRWEEFKDGTIGNDRYPDYQIVWTDNNNENHELTDGYTSTSDLIKINVISKTAPVSRLVYSDGVLLAHDAKGNYDLDEGDNRFGIEIDGQIDGTDQNGNTVQTYSIIDFQYINVIYTPETTTTTTINGQPQINNLSPSSGLPGTSVDINGSGFGNNQTVWDAVNVGGEKAKILSWTGNKITIEMPGTPAGPQPVVVWTGETAKSPSNSVDFNVGAVTLQIASPQVVTTQSNTAAPDVVYKFIATVDHYASNMIFEWSVNGAQFANYGENVGVPANQNYYEPGLSPGINTIKVRITVINLETNNEDVLAEENTQVNVVISSDEGSNP